MVDVLVHRVAARLIWQLILQGLWQNSKTAWQQPGPPGWGHDRMQLNGLPALPQCSRSGLGTRLQSPLILLTCRLRDSGWEPQAWLTTHGPTSHPVFLCVKGAMLYSVLGQLRWPESGAGTVSCFCSFLFQVIEEGFMQCSAVHILFGTC